MFFLSGQSLILDVAGCHMGKGARAGAFMRSSAKVLIEQWRQEYNQVRPHSYLGYRPPAPEAKILETLTL